MHNVADAPSAALSTGASERIHNAVHFEHLDFLRACAVLLVFQSHLIRILFGTKGTGLGTAGHFGVLIFFVHTSLVLFMSMERLSSNAHWVWRFYVRRFFRIYPLAIVAVLAMLASHFPPAPWTPDPHSSAFDIAANLLLIQNLVGVPNILVTLWSLPFEVQMYVILPALYALRKTVSAWTVWVVAFVFAEVVMVVWSPLGEITRYFPCFCGGLVSYSLLRKKTGIRIPFWLYPILIAVSLTATVGLGHFRKFPVAIEGLAALSVGIYTGLATGSVPPVLARVSSWIARYSYGIYLAHLPVMMWLLQKPLSAGKVVLFVIAEVAVPVIAYHAIEEPLIRLGARLARSSGTRSIKVERQSASAG